MKLLLSTWNHFFRHETTFGDINLVPLFLTFFLTFMSVRCNLALFPAIWPARICSLFHKFGTSMAFPGAILQLGTSMWALHARNYGGLAGQVSLFLLKITLKKLCAGFPKLGRWPHDYCLLWVDLHHRIVFAVCALAGQSRLGSLFLGWDHGEVQSHFSHATPAHARLCQCVVCSSSNSRVLE